MLSDCVVTMNSLSFVGTNSEITSPIVMSSNNAITSETISSLSAKPMRAPISVSSTLSSAAWLGTSTSNALIASAI